MSDVSDSRPGIWIRAWPAWLLLAVLALVLAVSAATAIMAPNVGSPLWAGLGLLALFGAPLLAAWGLWSVLGVRHWALRLGVYILVMVALLGGLFLLAVMSLPIL